MRYSGVVLFVALQVVFSSLPYLETGHLRHTTSEKVRHPSISFTCSRAFPSLMYKLEFPF